MVQRMARAALSWLLCMGLLPAVGVAEVHGSSSAPEAPICYKSGTIVADETWTPSCIYVIQDGDLYIADTATVTIQPGVIVKFRGDRNQYNRNLYVSGRLLAQGTAAAKIYFTSLRDDSVGGDTNGDGGATAPAAADWGRIEFSGSSTGSIIDNAVVRYGGYVGWVGNFAALRILGASPTIRHTTISGNYHDGILCSSSAAPSISDSTISSNVGYGIYVDETSTPTVSNCDISDNGSWAISSSPTVFPVLTGNHLAGNHGNGLELRGGPVNVNTTWGLTEHPYAVTGDVSVGNGVTLTIQPGVIVKFRGDRNQYNRSLYVNGTLLAQGTAAAKIYFTSLRDDGVGGDTNGDGGATAPAAADWGRIEFSGSSTGSIIDNAVVRYGGYVGWVGNFAALRILGASPTIRHTTISGNYHDGVACYSSARPAISDSTISSNARYGIYVDETSTPTVSNCDISDNGSWAISSSPTVFPVLTGNHLVRNHGNGLELRGGAVNVDTTWGLTEHVYAVTGDVSVGNGVTLTIQPGVIVKFRGDRNQYNRSLYINGTLLAQGTPAARIYFTSLRDDSAGGDTNGDGGATAPAEADWGRIEFSGSSTGSIIEHAVVRYGGYVGSVGNFGAIHVLGASPQILRTMIIANRNGVWAKSLANPVIHYCKIEQNVQYGVRNDDPNVLVDASYNWWEDPQGPSTETYTTPKGDKVSNYVDYTPWLPQSPFAPVVTSLSVSTVTNDKDQTVVVTGKGFLPTPAVKLDGQPMGGVTWRSDTEISFVIPAGFPVGVYALTIVNPDGEQTVVPDAITVRSATLPVYLPAVLRISR